MPKKKTSKTTRKLSKSPSRKRHAGYGVVVGMMLVGVFVLYLGFNNIKRTAVTTFEQCSEKVGAVVNETSPRECILYGKKYLESAESVPPEILQIKKGTNDLDLGFERGNYIINSQVEWDALFSEYDIEPNIDFTEKTVIAVVMGQKPSGGYSVGLKQIEVGGEYIQFMVNEVIPGEDCIVTEALTNPYQIIAIEKTDKEISFLGDTVVSDCSN